jgi:L-asparaginase II
MIDSTLYTIGTALGRARDNDVTVQVLVGGQWLEGLVSAVDGHGLVLVSPGDEHAVVRMSDISAVRVLKALPIETSTRAYQAGGSPHPMPGPSPRVSAE